MALGLLDSVSATEVIGYSVIKGHFLEQRGPEELVLDSFFGFSVLGSIDLSDSKLISAGQVRLPEGRTVDLEDFGDTWTLLESFETQAELDAAYQWGDYIVTFDSRVEGPHACLLELPETPLPPVPRLTNFEASLSVDPSRPLTLNYTFDGALAKRDFVQAYVTLGHGEVFATPNQGEPGALTIEDRTVTIPAGTLVPGFVHSLNLEATRVTGTNDACYPGVQGYAAVFRSTSVDLLVLTPPSLRFLTATAAGSIELEVVGDPGGTIVLEGSGDLRSWTAIATNRSDSGTNTFAVARDGKEHRFFRAAQDAPPIPNAFGRAPAAQLSAGIAVGLRVGVARGGSAPRGTRISRSPFATRDLTRRGTRE